MNKKNEVDQMLEDFLRSEDGVQNQPGQNKLTADDFNAKVLAALPQQPRLVWITSIYPVLGILMGAFVVWKVSFFHPATLLVWADKLSLYFGIELTSVSATMSVGAIVGVVAIAAYFLHEKIEEI